MDKKPYPRLSALEEAYKNVLNPKEMMFPRQYLVDFEATQAALRSGWTHYPTARGQACNLFKKKEIVEMIEAGKRDLAEMVTMNNLMDKLEAGRILSDIARGTIVDHLTPEGELIVDRGRAAGIQDLATFKGKVSKIKMISKIDAIARLAKMFGWDEPDKVVISDGKSFRDMSDEELERKIREEEDRLAASSDGAPEEETSEE